MWSWQGRPFRQPKTLALVALLVLASPLLRPCHAALNALQQGCLYNKLGSHNQLRVCNSDDYRAMLVDENATDPVASGICRAPDFDYLEVRIKCQDWESVLFGSWVLQILLSEILGVPTTLETGLPDAVMQYYDRDARFEFGTTSNNLQAFRNAVELGDGDCRNVFQNSTDPEDYRSCAHVIPEVWTARSKQVQEYIQEEILDAPVALGALGIEGWYIPKYTAEMDPSLTSWIGLQGEENRHKLARTFQRPTTWMDYCEQVSANNCSVPDQVAQRPPEDEFESQRLHSSGLFTGYFRPTEQGDCQANPTNCTGHIGDFPCGWGGALEATCHWLNISLESNGPEPNSGGYTYGQLSQMWRAANETRNHVAMMWVVPDPVYEEFMGTDYEFVKVTLPAPTQKCQQYKIDPENRCSDDPKLRLGTAEGVCDESARPLYKLLLSKLYDLTEGPSIPEAIQSPAHSVVSQFSLSELQINDMFRYWSLQPDEPREAICQWVVDNLDDFHQFFPRSYPRTVQDTSHDKTSTSYIVSILASVLGAFATLLVICTTAMVYHHRGRRVMRYAQIEFLYLLLLGSAMVSIGAILTGMQTPPSNEACIAQVWLIALGYTLELVPLLVKVAAINSLMQAAQRMKRVTLERGTLHGGVAAIGLLVTVFLVIWTVLDPPQKEAIYQLTDQVLVNGDGTQNLEEASLFDTTVVQVQYFCSSNSDSWAYVAIAWNLILILIATALAFQSRAVKQHFNEAQVISRLVYSHFLFVLLRVMAHFFDPSATMPMLSIIYSLDTICTVLVYFVPKFLADDHGGGRMTSAFDTGLGSYLPSNHSGFSANSGALDAGSSHQKRFSSVYGPFHQSHRPSCAKWNAVPKMDAPDAAVLDVSYPRSSLSGGRTNEGMDCSSHKRDSVLNEAPESKRESISTDDTRGCGCCSSGNISFGGELSNESGELSHDSTEKQGNDAENASVHDQETGDGSDCDPSPADDVSTAEGFDDEPNKSKVTSHIDV